MGNKWPYPKYALLIFLPVIYDLTVSKSLQNALIEYDVAYLLAAFGLNVAIAVAVIRRLLKAGTRSFHFLDLLLAAVLLYSFLIIFGCTPSFAEIF